MTPAVPCHLREIAEITECRRDEITLSLRCSCGCERFLIFENTMTPAEKAEAAEYARISREMLRGVKRLSSRAGADGSVHVFAHRFLHPPQEIALPPEPFAMQLSRILVRCAACGRETVLFDNRFHGYDGAVCGKEIPQDYAPVMQQKFQRSFPARRLRVRLQCSVPEAELCELAGAEDAIGNLCSECFTEIVISSETADGKFRTFFSEETA